MSFSLSSSQPLKPQNKKHSVGVRNQNEVLYIINSAGIVSHQGEALYIIIAKADLYTPKGVMIYKSGMTALDDMHANA